MIKSALVLGMCALHGISGNSSGPESGTTGEFSGEDVSLTSCSSSEVSAASRVSDRVDSPSGESKSGSEAVSF